MFPGRCPFFHSHGAVSSARYSPLFPAAYRWRGTSLVHRGERNHAVRASSSTRPDRRVRPRRSGPDRHRRRARSAPPTRIASSSRSSTPQNSVPKRYASFTRQWVPAAYATKPGSSDCSATPTPSPSTPITPAPATPPSANSSSGTTTTGWRSASDHPIGASATTHGYRPRTPSGHTPWSQPSAGGRGRREDNPARRTVVRLS